VAYTFFSSLTSGLDFIGATLSAVLWDDDLEVTTFGFFLCVLSSTGETDRSRLRESSRFLDDEVFLRLDFFPSLIGATRNK
jgi:hypothetical protein